LFDGIQEIIQKMNALMESKKPFRIHDLCVCV
jgi:hypothetical protein